MRHLLLALPLILGLLQDDARIDDLVRKLDDADLEVREGAVRDLVKAGAKALEPLRKALKSESAEVRLRATQALRTIENDLKARQVCPEHKPLALKRSGTVGEILDDLAGQTGAKFDASPSLRESKAAVEAVTLLQALDQICASQDKLTFSTGEDGSIRFASARHPKSPAAYFEGFKIFLTEVKAERRTDFKDATVTAQFSIHAAWDPRLKPVRFVRYESLEAKDEAGRVVEVGAPTQNPLAFGGGIVMVAGMGMGGEVDLT
ncbi:MAG TPA: HEAT repeat domain-containing protein, partial [Planctomycetota bacterium]|nr:HEAT repeat domain-containing protein [Planctomycetota bacterium]